MIKNIVLCGVGGQGTVLASKLLAAAAMEQNIPVMSADCIRNNFSDVCCCDLAYTGIGNFAAKLAPA